MVLETCDRHDENANDRALRFFAHGAQVYALLLHRLAVSLG